MYIIENGILTTTGKNSIKPVNVRLIGAYKTYKQGVVDNFKRSRVKEVTGENNSLKVGDVELAISSKDSACGDVVYAKRMDDGFYFFVKN